MHDLFEQRACEPGGATRHPLARRSQAAVSAARRVAMHARAATLAGVLALGTSTAGAQVVTTEGTGAGSTASAAGHSPATAGDIAHRLAVADRIRRSDPAGFSDALARLDLEQATMTPAEREHYAYLRGWERVFASDYERGIAILTQLRDGASDSLIRFRAGGTLVNAYNVTRRYQEAFEQLNDVLDQLPQVTDPEARAQLLSVAAQLYALAGQNQTANEYADRLMRESTLPWAQCFAAQVKYDSLERSVPDATPDAAMNLWIERCTAQGEDILANLMRVSRARMLVRSGDHRGAVDDLERGYAMVLRLNYGPLLGLYAGVYAEAMRGLGDDPRAARSAKAALAAMQSARGNEPLVRALHTLYLIAKSQGDVDGALSWHEQYVAADTAWSDEQNERLLAYQMASHEARARALEIERLASENRVLQLQQELGSAAARTQQLAITLLLVVLASIAFWTWRLKQSRERFRLQAQQDALTGIAARQHFMAVATVALAECRRRKQPAALVLIDLDHFKQINDIHGHAAGDDVLRQAVAACRPRIGSHGVFGRLGGEEFGVLLPNTGAAEANAIAQACRAAVAAVDRLEDDSPISVSASFGIAIADAGQDLRELLIAADAALYEAKRQGRNRVVDWEAGLAKPRPVSAVPATASGHS